MKKIVANCFRYLIFILLGLLLLFKGFAKEIGNNREVKPPGLRIAVFDVDATPPPGSMLALDPMINTWDMGLRAKGIVLLGADQPIVLFSVDWLDICNEGQDEFKNALANAAGTIPQRVAVHTIHQHDAPRIDFGAERLLIEAGFDPMAWEGSFAREVIKRLETAIQESLDNTQPITHVGLGEAEVYKVASNRRIMGEDGRVRAGRMTTCRDSALRAEPEGVIDPMVSLVSFWNNDKPLAVLSYYATHPQSYYRTGIPNPDFPGIARFFRQLAVPEALHIHFTGAGGNIGAGKYNDGSRENRLILAERLADGMKRAWEATKLEPITINSTSWNVEYVALTPAQKLEKLQEDISVNKKLLAEGRNANMLAFLQRYQEGKKIDIACLSLGSARILHMPGELFVEYQLAAKAIRSDLFVTMAAYGDRGMRYIGTANSYKEGGYEIGASDVSPKVENVLMTAIRNLLKDR